MMLKNAALVMVVLGGLTGCGAGSSSGDGADDDRAVSALSAALQEQEGRLSLPPLDATQADCVATGLVDTPGTGALVEHGILDSDLNVELSDQPLAVPTKPAIEMVSVITDCVDLVRMQQEEMWDDEDPPAIRKCFEDTLDVAGIRRLLLSGLTGDRAGSRELTRDLRECIAINGYAWEW